MEVFVTFVIVFVLLLACTKFFLQKNAEHSDKFINRKFPLVKWTRPYLPIINGFITLIKLRTVGVKIGDIINDYGLSSRLDIPYVKAIATCDPNLLQKLLTSTSPGHLNKPMPIFKALITDYIKDSIAVSDVSIWSHRRRVISRAFTYKSFPTYLKFINAAAENIIKSACTIATNNSDNTIDNAQMKNLVDHHAIKIITQIIMGSECLQCLDEDMEEFHETFRRCKDITVKRFLNSIQLIPLVWKFHPNNRKLAYYVGQSTKFSYKMIDKHRLKDLSESKEDLEEQQGSSMNGTMGYSCYSGESETDVGLGMKPFECVIEQMIKAGYNNEEIANEINTLLAVGHETTVASLDMIMFHLASNLEHQEICRAEVNKLFDNNKDKTDSAFSQNDVSKLEYLERCIFESMRITPTLPFFLRQLDSPLEVKEDCFIEANTSILANLWSLHRNPDIYPNPTKFDPDRFLSENVKKRHPFSFIPFSSGPRNCLGYKVALLEMKVIMAWILRYFEITTTDKLDDVKLIFDFTLKPERMYNITFKKRSGIY